MDVSGNEISGPHCADFNSIDLPTCILLFQLDCYIYSEALAYDFNLKNILVSRT